MVLRHAVKRFGKLVAQAGIGNGIRHGTCTITRTCEQRQGRCRQGIAGLQWVVVRSEKRVVGNADHEMPRCRTRRDTLGVMKQTLQVLNELEQEGLMSRYAIGGAMGATFYVEPLLTFDLDVFVVLPQTAGGLLSLAPIYGALRARGYAEEDECVLIEGVPVQFLPAYNALLEEALVEARETTYEDTPARVVRAEHLVAICLQTGRDKDRERLRILRAQAKLDMDYLAGVLARHQLEARWSEWKG